ncbi:MAG TPA: RNA polymerase sigma factor [Blastocatellia bacterium]|nr:RNA polymerase sigma factor [Blastocatellia bacterium]
MSQISKWDLDQETFGKLLAMFDSDINVAGEKYECVRCGIVKYFECRGCLPALDLADETINRVARKLGEGAEIQHGSFSSYFYGVARNVFHEHLRRVDRNLAPVEILLPHQHPSVRPFEMHEGRSDQVDLEAKLACLDACTESLPEGTRKMILSYYEGKERARIENRKRLAETLGVPMNSLRIRVHRIREKLEGCLINCLARSVTGLKQNHPHYHS